jgi:hypothetical protein
MLHFCISYRLAFSYYSATGHQFHNLLYRCIHFVRYYIESLPCPSDTYRWCVCPYLVSNARRSQNTVWRVTARGASFLSSIGPAWLQHRIMWVLVRLSDCTIASARGLPFYCCDVMKTYIEISPCGLSGNLIYSIVFILPSIPSSHK